MRRWPKGFTLVEVVIAMMIMSFLSLFTVQSIQRALRTKAKVQKEIDKNATVRDALRIMERDINMAFNYRDISVELYNLAQKERRVRAQKPTPNNSNAPPGSPPTPPPPPVNPEEDFKLKTEKIYTHFIGEPDSLSFTSVSNVRLSEDSPISSQAEIGYRIKSCRRRSTQEQSSKCLWRRIANYIHDDITKEGTETVLLENIVDFKFRYLGPGRNDEWVDTWITNERGDDQTKNKFPYAVEITIEVKDTGTNSNDKSLRMTTVASIRNPNNQTEEPKKDGTPIPGTQ